MGAAMQQLPVVARPASTTTAAAAAAAAAGGDSKDAQHACVLVADASTLKERQQPPAAARSMQQPPPPPPPPQQQQVPARPPCTPRTALLRVYRFAVAQWFILGLGVAIGFAAALPKLGATGGWLRAEYSVKLPAIITIFIISGIGLKTKALLSALGDLRVHLLVQGLSLAAVPAIGFGVATGLQHTAFNPHLANGLVIMACMPTTVSTNVVYTQRAAGNEPAALVNAVLGNIIGIFITPLWLSLFLSVSGAAPYAAVLTELTYTIIAPLIVGQLLQYLAPRAVAWLKRSVNTGDVSSCCILLLVWITFCNTFANAAMRSVPGGDVAATVFLAGALFGLFTALCFAAAWPPRPLARLRLPRRDVVAVVICGATKTVAMGVPLITVMYKDVPHAGLLALPLIVYHALQVLLGGLMLGAFRAWCLAGGSERGGAPAGQAGAASGPAAAAAAAAAAEAEAAGAPAAGAGSEARSSL